MPYDVSTFKVNAAWDGSSYGDEVATGAYYGINAFSSLDDAFGVYGDHDHRNTETTKIEILSDITSTATGKLFFFSDVDVDIVAASEVTLNMASHSRVYFMGYYEVTDYTGTPSSVPTFTIGENVTLVAQNMMAGQNIDIDDVDEHGDATRDPGAAKVIVDGTIRVDQAYSAAFSTITISETGKQIKTGTNDSIVRAQGIYEIIGDGTKTEVQMSSGYYTNYGGLFSLKDTYAQVGQIRLSDRSDEDLPYRRDHGVIIADNTKLESHYDINISDEDGLLMLQNGSTLSKIDAGISLINAGAVVVDDSTMTVATINNTGSIDLVNGAVANVTSTITNNGTIAMDASSTLTGTTISGAGTITIDAEGFTAGLVKVIDLSAESSIEAMVTVNNLEAGVFAIYGDDGDVTLTDAVMSTYKVNSAWASSSYGDMVETGYYYGINAFSSFATAITGIKDETTTIELASDISEEILVPVVYLNHDLAVTTADGVSTATVNWTVTGNSPAAPDTDGKAYFLKDPATESATITFGEGVTLNVPNLPGAYKGDAIYFGYNTNNAMTVQIDGALNTWTFYASIETDVTVSSTGSVSTTGAFIVRRYATVTFNGEDNFTSSVPQANLTWMSQQGGIINLNDTVINAGSYWEMWNRNSLPADTIVLNMDNSTVIASKFKGDGANLPLQGFYVNMDNGSSIQVTGEVSNVGIFTMTDSSISGTDLKQMLNPDAVFTADSSVISLTGSLLNNATITITDSDLTAGVVDNTGDITIADSTLTLGTARETLTFITFAGTNSVTVTGEGKTSTDALRAYLDDATLTDFSSNITVYIRGNGALTGTTTINGVLNVDTDYVDEAYDGALEPQEWTITGNFSASQLNVGGYPEQDILNIGDADGARTTVTLTNMFYQLWHAVVNVENADITTGAAGSVTGWMTLDNSTYIGATRVNGNNEGEDDGVLLLKNGSLVQDSNGHVGSVSDKTASQWGGTIRVTENSTYRLTGNTGYTTATAKIIAEDSTIEFTGTDFDNRGTISLTSSEMTAVKLTNRGTVTVDKDSSLTVTSRIDDSGTVEIRGTATINELIGTSFTVYAGAVVSVGTITVDELTMELGSTLSITGEGSTINAVTVTGLIEGDAKYTLVAAGWDGTFASGTIAYDGLSYIFNGVDRYTNDATTVRFTVTAGNLYLQDSAADTTVIYVGDMDDDTVWTGTPGSRTATIGGVVYEEGVNAFASQAEAQTSGVDMTKVTHLKVENEDTTGSMAADIGTGLAVIDVLAASDADEQTNRTVSVIDQEIDVAGDMALNIVNGAELSGQGGGTNDFTIAGNVVINNEGHLDVNMLVAGDLVITNTSDYTLTGSYTVDGDIELDNTGTADTLELTSTSGNITVTNSGTMNIVDMTAASFGKTVTLVNTGDVTDLDIVTDAFSGTVSLAGAGTWTDVSIEAAILYLNGITIELADSTVDTVYLNDAAMENAGGTLTISGTSVIGRVSGTYFDGADFQHSGTLVLAEDGLDQLANISVDGVTTLQFTGDGSTTANTFSNSAMQTYYFANMQIDNPAVVEWTYTDADVLDYNLDMQIGIDGAKITVVGKSTRCDVMGRSAD